MDWPGGTEGKRGDDEVGVRQVTMGQALLQTSH